MALHFLRHIFCKHFYITVDFKYEKYCNFFGYSYFVKHYRYRCLKCGKEKSETVIS